MHAQNQGKLASVCLQRFSSIFETTIAVCQQNKNNFKLDGQLSKDKLKVIFIYIP